MGSKARTWATRFAALTMVVLLFTPTTVSAEMSESTSIAETGSIALGSDGVWDPDDVQGRYDFRWVGAAYTSGGQIHLSVSFYDAFRLRRLPREISDLRSHVSVWLSGALNGYFIRQPGGRVIFVWGDFGSFCCKTVDVTRPAPKVFSVTFNPCGYVHGGEVDMALGESLWRTHNIRARDRTGKVELSNPNCDED